MRSTAVACNEVAEHIWFDDFFGSREHALSADDRNGVILAGVLARDIMQSRCGHRNDLFAGFVA